ncbi:MAG: PQQ-dependent sugar dehydrogenase [Myxococcales bacterium]|nr:PQQ-dependent sugar dehydrogenase [Myxococcota bacterium]MDW8281486.1 PQQ-dependent sugar dehydrogenase [Myxococcales bacterium]
MSDGFWRALASRPALQAAGLLLVLGGGPSVLGWLQGVSMPQALARARQVTDETLAQRVRVPPGFSVGVYAAELPMARMLRFTRGGHLLVSRPRFGEVTLLEADRDGDGRANGRRALLKGLVDPHGLDIHQGVLYVAEGDAVLRVALDEERGELRGPPERIVRGLPRGGGHWTRSLVIGPDQHLYVSIGSSCNVCRERDPRRATIMRFALDGSGGRIYASGLRNAVGMAFQPGTGRLYATDNGRDLLGDDFPPCELNLIEDGGFYGWPFANGNRVPDPDLGAGHEREIAASRPPVHSFPAHNAPLGLTFARGARLPPGWQGDRVALVALHGSWNRSRKSGYKVVALHLDERGGIRQEDFLWGFLRDQDQSVSGRPVDVAIGPDGAIYVSDDHAGAIYRIAYRSN